VYRERRCLLAKQLRRLPHQGLPLTLARLAEATLGYCARSMEAACLEYAPTAAQIARERGLNVIRADARELPVRSGSMDLVTAFDILEHIEETTWQQRKYAGCSAMAAPR